ncbi:unnamed protein product [Polarella glacialis]|uniref:Uncharacterized protein n=1 Tax=Polarella glacialis TaxID=89957 RepID=A0A813LYL4_POLGL|nr:unnamed protein product [Polarella glacialis]
MNKVREGHVAAAVGLGVAAAFTAGATAGLCATTTAKAAACECNFLAYCIQVGLKSGMIQAPKPSGKDMVDPKKIPDLQLWGVCQRLMQEENMAAEYALVKAQHDCFVVKIVSICISAGAGVAQVFLNCVVVVVVVGFVVISCCFYYLFPSVSPLGQAAVIWSTSAWSSMGCPSSSTLGFVYFYVKHFLFG